MSEQAMMPSATVFPRKLLALGIAAIVLMLAVSSSLTWRVGDQIRSVINSQIEVLTAAERLEHYGSVLELSIKAVVANGDPEAAARYREVQPELRKTLADLRAELQLSQNRIEASRVDQVDRNLVAMEYAALAFVEDRNFTEARRIIHSARYDQLIQDYGAGIHRIEQRAVKYVDATQRKLDRYLTMVVALSIASFSVLFIGWMTVVRPAQRWGAQLEVAREAAEHAWQGLAEAQGELKNANRQLFDQARTDPLTRLQTRVKFAEDAERIWSRVARFGESYSMVMCDVDHFKQYNDTYGHVAGDEVLRAVARGFESVARLGDQLYRYGGEEFVLLLPTESLQSGRAIAERFRAAIAAMRLPHAACSLGFVSVSMGVAQLQPGNQLTAAQLLEQADAAMYEAKVAGRNRVVVHAA